MHHLQYILISQDYIKIQCTVEQFSLFTSVDQCLIQEDCKPLLPWLVPESGIPACRSLESVPGSPTSLCDQQ